jgi:hypothetical protein
VSCVEDGLDLAKLSIQRVNSPKSCAPAGCHLTTSYSVPRVPRLRAPNFKDRAEIITKNQTGQASGDDAK